MFPPLNLAIIGTEQVISHCLNQCWHIGNWTFKIQFQWNLIQNMKLITREKRISKMVGVLCQSQCVKENLIWEEINDFNNGQVILYEIKRALSNNIWKKNWHILLCVCQTEANRREESKETRDESVGSAQSNYVTDERIISTDPFCRQPPLQGCIASELVDEIRCSAFKTYRQVSNIIRIKSQHFKDPRTVLRLSLLNPLKPDVKSRMKM